MSRIDGFNLVLPRAYFESCRPALWTSGRTAHVSNGKARPVPRILRCVEPGRSRAIPHLEHSIPNLGDSVHAKFAATTRNTEGRASAIFGALDRRFGPGR